MFDQNDLLLPVTTSTDAADASYNGRATETTWSVFLCVSKEKLLIEKKQTNITSKPN